MYFSWLVFIALFTFAASTLYFYIFSRKQEKFMQYWGFSWIAYSMSLLCLLCFFASPNDLFLELRKVVDMFNLLLLLFGSYSYTHIKVPTYWYRFSLYLLLLAVICMIYSFDLLSFYLPISIYQLIITAFLCYNIWQKWDIIMAERIIGFLFMGSDQIGIFHRGNSSVGHVQLLRYRDPDVESGQLLYPGDLRRIHPAGKRPVQQSLPNGCR